MALSLDSEDIDRVTGGIEDYDPMYDGHHHQLGNFSPLTRIGIVEDSELTANSTLAGVDPTTGLRWQYQDKMVVMGVVFGCVILCGALILGLFMYFRRLRKKGEVVCAQEFGSSPGHPHLDSSFLGHLVPRQKLMRETLNYEGTASKVNRYPSSASSGVTAHFERKQQFPIYSSVVATDASATNSNTTVSSFKNFLSAATPSPPPEHKALPSKVGVLPNTGQCKSESRSSLPAYIANSDIGTVQGEANQKTPQLDVPPVALLRPLSLSVVNRQPEGASTPQGPEKAHSNRVPFDQWRFGL